ncbi:unnamed protein product [Ranitomeya imitator]|uniref:PH domain-containing protein n=1 Tax=Ranitomeya imitator TaxID=111125 RepID=A0ABN9M3Y5_9NEOB|nr:unnamed protein product [Ranitomeya imitator]
MLSVIVQEEEEEEVSCDITYCEWWILCYLLYIEVLSVIVQEEEDSPQVEMALVKSGWLWRQSSVLRRWKKQWFDLWMDGALVYYPDMIVAEARRSASY